MHNNTIGSARMIMNVDSLSICVGDIISIIEDNTRNIAILTRKRIKRGERISARLDLLRSTKRYLTQAQVEAYATFSMTSANEGRNIKEFMEEVDKLKSLPNVKRQLLNSDTDFSSVMEDLEEVAKYQKEIISALTNIIDSANNALMLL